MNQPIQIQGKVITISLINAVQEQMLQTIKEELLPKLRLHHPDLTIQGLSVEQPAAQKPYTDQEKLSYLSKKKCGHRIATRTTYVRGSLLKEFFVFKQCFHKIKSMHARFTLFRN